MVSNLKHLLLLLLAAVGLCAQVPNCQINFGPWTDLNQSPPFDNRTASCGYWVMTYQVTGFTAVSIEFDSAIGAVTPGAFGLFSGTLSSGANPSTSVACATVTNCTSTFTGNVGWYRVKFGSYTGLGTIQGTLQGYKAGVPLGGSSTGPGSGCPGTVVTPCVVVGNVAAGSVAAGAPVQTAGNDGTNVRQIRTDATGRQVEVGAAAQGAAVAGNPVLVADWDGTNVRTPVYCPNQAVISTSAGTALIIPLAAAKSTYICQIQITPATAVNVQFEAGTGGTCAVATVNLTGNYQAVLAAVLPFQQNAPLVAGVGLNVCMVQSGIVDIEGVVMYAQF